MIRTTAEILARMDEVKDQFLEFQFGDLLEWLPYEHAREHLKDGITAEKWAEFQKDGDPLDQVREYLPFAWNKANGQRGLSASRSVSHMKAWLWLAGYDLSDELDSQYQFYGKPSLVIASTIAGFPWRDHDDGHWANDEGSRSILASEIAGYVDIAERTARGTTPEKGARDE